MLCSGFEYDRAGAVPIALQPLRRAAARLKLTGAATRPAPDHDRFTEEIGEQVHASADAHHVIGERDWEVRR